MNEQIHNAIKLLGGIQYNDDNEPIGCAVLVGKDLEKFAELIIQECAYVWLMNPRAHPNLLLEHFGIEDKPVVK